jgi:hypothetical protein
LANKKTPLDARGFLFGVTSPIYQDGLTTLLELAPLTYRPVAGFHRASPSTSLDKSIQFLVFIAH